ncbi:hypothetical protein M0804_002856 [Polistes exclamans]|nr:hypothetical protein M0804_002856 [Polistes exclamans]
MPRNVTGQILFIFLSLFLFDDAKAFEINRFYEIDWPSGLRQFVRLEEPLKPVKNSFWQGPTHLGHISGVSVDPSGYPVIFHRADRLWGFFTFTKSNHYTEQAKGPITENTVLKLHPKTGDILHGWGNNTFYFPHGIHIDNFGNVWLTDIALHQVFKYDSSGVLKLSLGEPFEPGNDLNHFCQPTSVAVSSSTGEIFIADGYCNSRIVLFDSMGNPKYSIDKSTMILNIPHSLTILSNGDLCVADRENERVVCIIGLTGSKTVFAGRKYSIPVPGRVFAIASYNDTIYTVDKMMCEYCAMGYMINPYIQQVVNMWSSGFDFHNPHDIGICQNSKSLYVSEIGPNRVWKFDLIKKR